LRRERLYLLDIADACRKIDRFTAGKSFEEFSQDEILFDAVVRNLQIIGEAVRCLPDDVRSLRPDVEWTRIVGLRHLLVHHYFGVDEEIVWDLAMNRCPELESAVTEMLPSVHENEQF
jgi:uncharacterized protein with HEPN domain